MTKWGLGIITFIHAEFQPEGSLSRGRLEHCNLCVLALMPIISLESQKKTQ